MTEADIAAERTRLAVLALEIASRRGEETTRAALAAESRLSRARIEMLFPEEEDLFDATVERWFAPEIEIMEQVLTTDLPPNRMLYEFIARRYLRRLASHGEDPVLYRMLCELGQQRLDRISGYIDLADHYLCEIIARAQADGYFADMDIERVRSLINQMTACYTMPDMIWILEDRLSEEKLGAIVDTVFAGLVAATGGAQGRSGLRAA